MREFDPRDHIDRIAEQELFRSLVTYESPARILTICDRGGQGKSSLLKRLRYNCDYEISPGIPSCLLELDKMRDPSPFAFALAVARGFAVRGKRDDSWFAEFHRFDNARTAKDFSPFENGGGGTVVGEARVETMYGGKNAAVMTEIASAEFVQVAGRQEFSAEQEELARSRCIDALFHGLHTVCPEQPMVLLLDGWERCNLDLRAWIFHELLAGHVLDPDRGSRPDKLALVIAARPHEPGVTQYGLRPDELRPLFDTDQEFDATVNSIKSLSEWDTPHIREFMVQNGCAEPTDAQVSVIREKLAKGQSLERIALLIELLRD